MSYEAALKEHYRGIHASFFPPVRKPICIPPVSSRRAREEQRRLRVFSIVEEGSNEPSIPVGIVREVCAKYRITPADLSGRRRSPVISPARHEVFYRLKNETRMSHTEIGDLFGKDHSSVIYGIKKHMERIEAAAGKNCKRKQDSPTAPDSVVLIKRPSEAKTGGH